MTTHQAHGKNAGLLLKKEEEKSENSSD